MTSPLSLAAVALVCLTTLAVGALGLRLSRRTSDFYVAGRTVSPRLNASAVGGEYLSAASFLGVAGLVYDGGVDMLWLPIGYTLGFLVLLVMVAAPMRRSGAYTLPDFAQVRLGSRAIRRVTAVLTVAPHLPFLPFPSHHHSHHRHFDCYFCLLRLASLMVLYRFFILLST